MHALIPRRGVRAARPGFTLLELVIVLAILALLASASIPALASAHAMRDDGDATRAVLALLGNARDAALAGGRSVELWLDPATGRYWLQRPAGDATARIEGRLALPAGARLTSDGPRARFRFAPDGPGDGWLVVDEPGAPRRVITVDPWTGEAHADAR